jgi:hypothetical protein
MMQYDNLGLNMLFASYWKANLYAAAELTLYNECILYMIRAMAVANLTSVIAWITLLNIRYQQFSRVHNLDMVITAFTQTMVTPEPFTPWCWLTNSMAH